MQIIISAGPRQRGLLTHRRVVALANIQWFRAMARWALRDGAPRAELRAANARAAARIVLRQARRDSLANRVATNALAGGG
jgi:hypothetical protein